MHTRTICELNIKKPQKHIGFETPYARYTSGVLNITLFISPAALHGDPADDRRVRKQEWSQDGENKMIRRKVLRRAAVCVWSFPRPDG